VSSPHSIFWFRRDLRLTDNAGLYQALKNKLPVLCLFIFDTEILDPLERDDARVTFIYEQIKTLHAELARFGSSLLVKKGKPSDIFKYLASNHQLSAVFANHDYEPYAIGRDQEIKEQLDAIGITFTTFKDQVIFEKDEVISGSGNPYKVYTPYKRKWLEQLNSFYLRPYPTEKYHGNYFRTEPLSLPSLEEIGFITSTLALPPSAIVEQEIMIYEQTRDFPRERSTSRLGIHLRFGTLSIRHIAAAARKLNETWLSELVWREFFMQLLYHFPEVVDHPFNQKFRTMQWRHHEKDFKTWCQGLTGYPMVDAGMRELNATGYMHNRVRMVAASFLTKHLLIDWRWGEAYFAQKLLDYELASNNGNWQWSAGTGADAQPFFRIFNPILQQQKFDPDFEYIRKWIPEFGTSAYPSPMVEHKTAVDRAKKAFGLLE
jgi:deoxyribodipyrimidine photo-lyase